MATTNDTSGSPCSRELKRPYASLEEGQNGGTANDPYATGGSGSSGDHKSSKRRPRKSTLNPQRQILLLDLDCFYAQAMCRRYGFDAEHTALALLQWNSVLAVTYPARKLYGIKRGDSWETVHQKSSGQCYAVHVPILTASTSNSSRSTVTAVNEDKDENGAAAAAASTIVGPSSSSAALSSAVHDEEYERFYCLSPEQQTVARHAELGVRKRSSQGKACIECFRIASARIFATVRSCLDERYPDAVLERASIDEFFLDVSKVVAGQETTDSSAASETESRQQTVVIGKEKVDEVNNDPEMDHDEEHNDGRDDDQHSLLWQSCAIAYGIRQVVYHTLGFTMSAGIGTNKTLAKLAVTYGKPAGQAVCFPDAIDFMLDDTAIKSCRNLGGKLGSAVQALLPPNVLPTVGAVAKYLSLPMLQQALGDLATAQRVHDIAHGIDHEAVESKTQSSAVLTKSITAFKSLNFAPPQPTTTSTTSSGAPLASTAMTRHGHGSGNSNGGDNAILGHTLTEAARWIELLAHEVVTRVERDAARNSRYPRSCTIQYAAAPATNHHNKSIRIAFPLSRLSVEQRIEQLVLGVPQAIRSKLGSISSGSDGGDTVKGVTFRLHRIGLCATDFETRAAMSNNAIDNYFAPALAAAATEATSDTAAAPPTQTLRPLPRDATVTEPAAVVQSAGAIVHSKVTVPVVVDADLEYAKQLQATYDRENTVLTVLDKSSKTKARARKSLQPKNHHRIDRFFQKK